MTDQTIMDNVPDTLTVVMVDKSGSILALQHLNETQPFQISDGADQVDR